jgi:surface protein
VVVVQAFDPLPDNNNNNRSEGLLKVVDDFLDPAKKDAVVTRYGPIADWNMSNVRSLKQLFMRKIYFTADLSKWDTSRVTSMESTFFCAGSFNSDLSKWDVSKVTTTHQAFFCLSQTCSQETGSSVFNADLSSWDVSNILDMSKTFFGANVFNSDLSHWDVSRVMSFQTMFAHASSFNSDISGWDVSNANNMVGMFSLAESFNSDVSKWDVSQIQDIGGIDGMFLGAAAFNRIWCSLTWSQTTIESDDFRHSANAKLFCCTPGTALNLSHTQAHDNVPLCYNCPVGQHKLLPSVDSSCDLCPSGWNQPSQKQQICFPCKLGSTQHGAGQAHCELCDAGRHMPRTRANDASCIACSRGAYQNQVGKSECHLCAPGQWSDQLGLTDVQCKECPQGTFSSASGVAMLSGCISCAPGTFSKLPGSTTCESCPAGWLQEDKRSSVCHKLKKNEISLGGGSASVIVPSGSYQTSCSVGDGEEWVVFCEGFSPCPAGWISSSDEEGAASQSCNECPRGTSSFQGTTYCR